MGKIKKICVFLGARLGNDEKYLIETQKLGVLLAERDITLVYGGAKNGLMGALADSVLNHGGKVIGVIPTCLTNNEYAHGGLTELITAASMAERKTLLKALADGFITLPGGMGTLDELFEVLTESKIGIHNKPIGLLNVDNFYDSILKFIDTMMAADFYGKPTIDNFKVSEQPRELLDKLMAKDQNVALPKNLLRNFSLFNSPGPAPQVTHSPSIALNSPSN